jgi:hypothetical protein
MDDKTCEMAYTLLQPALKASSGTLAGSVVGEMLVKELGHRWSSPKGEFKGITTKQPELKLAGFLTAFLLVRLRPWSVEQACQEIIVQVNDEVSLASAEVPWPVSVESPARTRPWRSTKPSEPSAKRRRVAVTPPRAEQRQDHVVAATSKACSDRALQPPVP